MNGNQPRRSSLQTRRHRDEEPDPEEEQEQEEEEEEEQEQERDAFGIHGPTLNANAMLRLFSLLQREEEDFNGNDALIEGLRRRGTLTSRRVEEALRTLPRGEFVPEEQQLEAYGDSPLPLRRWGFNVSAPHMYVLCLQALDPLPGMSFLDVGSGCGHLTALASFLTHPEGKTLGVDVREDVVEFSRENVKKFCAKHQISLTCEFEARNCFIPDIDERKFDRIHCGASCPQSFLPTLISLLNPKGILVTPCGDELLKIKKDEEGKETTEVICNVRYGELVLPSMTEIHAARFENERKRARMIKIQNSTYMKDKQSLSIDEPEIQEVLKGGFQETSSTDLIFKVQGVTFYAHRRLIGKRCDHFGAMFSSGMKDSNLKEIDVFPNCEPTSFAEFLRYLYSDEADINSENVADLLEIASFYQVSRLVNLCEHFFKTGIDEENCCDLLATADYHGSIQLKNFCQSFIIDHFGCVRKSEGFQNLRRELLVEITAAACFQLGLATENHKKY